MSGASDVEILSDDVRTLASELRLLVSQMEQQQHAGVHVTHTQAGHGGFMAGVGIASCVATVVLMIAFMIIENRSYAHLDNQVDQIKAWSDIHGRDIARLQAQKPKE